MWAAHNWRTPTGGNRVTKYFVLGTWQQTPTDGKTPTDAERDDSFPFHGGVVYAQRPWSRSWPDKSWQRLANVPDEGLPFDWEVYHFVKGIYVRLKLPFGMPAVGDMSGPVKNFIADRKRLKEEEAKGLAQVQEDGRTRFRDSMKTNYAQKALEEFTEDVRAGRPTYRTKDVTPMVYLKSRAKRAQQPAPPAAALESGATGIR